VVPKLCRFRFGRKNARVFPSLNRIAYQRSGTVKPTLSTRSASGTRPYKQTKQFTFPLRIYEKADHVARVDPETDGGPLSDKRTEVNRIRLEVFPYNVPTPNRDHRPLSLLRVPLQIAIRETSVQFAQAVESYLFPDA
jgi:hypothetical protein